MKQFFTLSLLLGCLTASGMSMTYHVPGRQTFTLHDSAMRDASAISVSVKPAEAGESSDLHDLPLIQTLPDGMDAELYSRDSYFFARDGQGQMFTMRDFGRVAYIAASDTEVYVENPFGGMPTHTWLKGERDGDKVTVSFPQLVYLEEYHDWENDPDEELGLTITDYYYAYKFILQVGDDKSSFVIDSDNPVVSFTLKDGKLVEDSDAYIGMVGEYRMYDEEMNPYIGFNWMGFADGMLEYTKVDAEVISVPEDAKFEKWILDNQGDQTFVEMAFDGEDVYLRGFIQTEVDGELEFPSVKGRLQDGNLIFNGVQYLGIDPRFEHLAYALPATYEVGEDEWAGEMVYTAADNLKLVYDAENRIFSAPADYSLVVSAIPDGIFTVMALDEPVLRWQDMSTPMVPCTPTDLYYEYMEDYEFGVFAFSISSVSEDGRLLDTSNLYYTIYVDGEEFTFYPDEYWDLEEPMTDVPYDYWDSYLNSFGDEHEVVLFAMNIEEVGVKAKYINTDGTVEYSDIATYLTSGINGVKEQAAVTDTEWYDLSGHRLNGPSEGFNIMRVTLEDGSVQVKKLVNLKK